MGIFSGILICTDLDGTLLKNDGTISDENLSAIEYFKQEGGVFTFITGRMPFTASHFYNVVKPNAPFGCINGGGLYDYLKQEYVWTSVLTNKVVELIEFAEKFFPDIGIQINTFYKTYFCKENQTMKIFRERTGLPNLICSYNEVREPVAKIVFGSEKEEDILNLQEKLMEHSLSKNFDFIRSEKTLFEILPKGIGKGVAIKRLVQYLDIDPNKTIAIGDYNNDISMFQAAKIGIAVSNACQEALDAADYITVSNEQNAIAKVIYDLQNLKYRL